MPYNVNVDFSENLTDTAAVSLNYVNPTAFKLIIDSQKYKNAQFMAQTVALPDIQLQGAVFQTRNRNIIEAPDKIDYGIFDMTFLIDEYLVNYKEIHDWMVGLVTEKDEGVRKERDMTLQILSSHNNVIAELQFVNALPINLSSLPFDVASTDVVYLTANVSFQFDYFKFVTKGV
tara:strand:- start:15269 stop:15793 length:525 start_codon:yes stop_codon:yes gene_type:complete